MWSGFILSVAIFGGLLLSRLFDPPSACNSKLIKIKIYIINVNILGSA